MLSNKVIVLYDVYFVISDKALQSFAVNAVGVSSFTAMIPTVSHSSSGHTHVLYRDMGMRGAESVPAFICCQKPVSLSSLWGRDREGPLSHTCAFKLPHLSHAEGDTAHAPAPDCPAIRFH